jgi:hypothetical protein
MVVEAHARGGELGSVLLDWAARSARQAGKSWLRLDAWKSNPALHQYYLDRGFTLVRMNDNPAGADVVHGTTTNNRELPPSDGFTGDRR